MGRQTKRKISSNQQKRTSLGRFTSGTRLLDVSSSSSEDEEIISEDEWLDHFNEEDVENLFVNAVQMAENENSLKITPWTTGCDLHIRAPYSGNSRATKFRHEKEKRELRTEAEKPGQSKITSFFKPITNIKPPPFAVTEDSIDKACEKLASLISYSRNKSQEAKTCFQSKCDFVRCQAVLKYLQLMMRNGSDSKIKSSEASAAIFYDGAGVTYKARSIRKWADFFLEHGQLPNFEQGRHRKTSTIIYDENYQMETLEWLRSQNPNSLSAGKLRKWFSSRFEAISRRSAHRLLHILGFSFSRYKKGLYIDGHERLDVVKHRKHFVSEVTEMQKRMSVFTGEDMEIEQLPDLQGQQRLVWVVHDETCFSANDAPNYIWMEKNRTPLRPKGDGRSIMVSGFMCECHGLMKLTDEDIAANPEISEIESWETIKPGKNADGYWTNEDLIKQFQEKALPIFEVLHPGCQGVFAFDNSQNHHAMKDDALVANRLNLKDGGKNVLKTRNGWFLNDDGQRQEQLMQNEQGLQLGIRSILQGRGKFKPGMKLHEAREVLQKEPDFLIQKCWLQETVESSGHRFIFFPKFHPEFNFIEMFWGAAKVYTREHCDYDWEGLIQRVPEALNHVPISSIRKFARKCFRYIDLYREQNGRTLSVKQVEYAAKKYKSHRRIPDSIFETLLNENNSNLNAQIE